MYMLLALLLCTCGAAVLDPARPEDHLAEEAENDVSLLQAKFRVQGDLSHQRRAREPPQLVVDLDVAPEYRWKNVTKFYVDLGVYPPVLQFSSSDPAIRELLESMKVDDEYMREMKGIIADVGLPESAVQSLLLAGINYELSGNRDGPRGILDEHNGTFLGCSGLLAAMPNGTVVHGRNLDYVGSNLTVNGHTLYLPEVTVEVLFMRYGRPLFVSVQWPGQIGIHTAMRFGGWSFQQNTRFHYMDSSILYGLFRGSKGFNLPARKIMETTEDFETAVRRLSEVNLMAPSYFIVAGPGAYEGAVITVDRGGGHGPGTPPVARLSGSKTMLRSGGQVAADWGIIQTNDDRDKRALDVRRPWEESRLAKSSQEMVSAEWVFGELMTPPVYNNLTIFTTLYIPATDYHKTVAHFGHTR